MAVQKSARAAQQSVLLIVAFGQYRVKKQVIGAAAGATVCSAFHNVGNLGNYRWRVPLVAGGSPPPEAISRGPGRSVGQRSISSSTRLP